MLAMKHMLHISTALWSFHRAFIDRTGLLAVVQIKYA